MNMKGRVYSSAEFEAMEFNPFGLKGKAIHEHYELLRRRPDKWAPPFFVPAFDGDTNPYVGWTEEDTGCMVSVAAMCIDDQSPLYDIGDLDFKVNSALESLRAAGLSTTPAAKEVSKTGRYFEKVLYEYFRIANDAEYEEWWTVKSLFHQMTRRVRSANNDLDDSTAAATLRYYAKLEEVKNKMYAIQQSLFHSERVERLITRQADADDPGGYVEQYALNEDPLLNGKENDGL